MANRFFRFGYIVCFCCYLGFSSGNALADTLCDVSTYTDQSHIFIGSNPEQVCSNSSIAYGFELNYYPYTPALQSNEYCGIYTKFLKGYCATKISGNKYEFVNAIVDTCFYDSLNPPHNIISPTIESFSPVMSSGEDCNWVCDPYTSPDSQEFIWGTGLNGKSNKSCYVMPSAGICPVGYTSVLTGSNGFGSATCQPDSQIPNCPAPNELYLTLNGYECKLIAPSNTPTPEPTTEPSTNPSGEPTSEPTTEPTGEPTTEPTGEPTFIVTNPSGEPTAEPTTEPTDEIIPCVGDQCDVQLDLEEDLPCRVDPCEVGQVFKDFLDQVQETELINAATGFFEYNPSGNCPVYSVSIEWTSITLDQWCSDIMNDIWPFIKAIVLALAGIVAMRIFFR